MLPLPALKNKNNNKEQSVSDNPERKSTKKVFVTRRIGIIKHKRLRMYKCQGCDLKFPTQGKLNKYYHTTHDKVKCNQCHMMFTTPSTLTRHMYSHQAPTQMCRCGKSFHFNSELQAHKLTNRQIKTQISSHPKCQWSYFSSSNLAKYTRTHENTVWRCEKCTYTMNDEGLLKSHQRQHNQPMNYMCS